MRAKPKTLRSSARGSELSARCRRRTFGCSDNGPWCSEPTRIRWTGRLFCSSARTGNCFYSARIRRSPKWLFPWAPSRADFASNTRWAAEVNRCRESSRDSSHRLASCSTRCGALQVFFLIYSMPFHPIFCAEPYAAIMKQLIRRMWKSKNANLPSHEVHAHVIRFRSEKNVEREVSLDHLIDSSNIRWPHVFLQEFELHSLISGSNDQAKEDVKREQESRKVPSRQNDDPTAEKNISRLWLRKVYQNQFNQRL